jgi:hypothetical protein
MMAPFEVTAILKEGGALTKRIGLGGGGELVSDGSACVMSRGRARRVELNSAQQLADLIGGLGSSEAVTLGALRKGLPDEVEVATKHRVNGASRPDLIARSRDYISFRPGVRAFTLIDYDTKGMPAEVGARIAALGGYWPTLTWILPALQNVAHVIRRSTSAGLYRTDTGAELSGSDGVHVYIPLLDGSDGERFLKVLHERCRLMGLGWMTVGAGGQLLERSIVDRVVGSPERLVFEGPPVLDPPLAQDQKSRRPIAVEGEALDSVAACPPLSIVDEARLKELRSKEVLSLAPEREKARQAFINRQAKEVAKTRSINISEARKIIERQIDGVLLPDVELPFDEAAFSGCTVADVLMDPGRFAGATMADPLEGPSYGPCKAMVLLHANGSPFIHSYAHGRIIYELKLDYRAAEAGLNKARPDDAASLFVRLVLDAELDCIEIERLRNLASKLSGTGKRFLDTLLKRSREEQAAAREREERERRIAERLDPRPQIPVPPRDAPWLPQMEVLKEVLGKAQQIEPPMRDIDGVLTAVRVRRVANMHAFTSLGANQEEPEETRLPPAEQPLLTQLSEAQAAELIERYIDYTDQEGRSVRLGSGFVNHFRVRQDDALPLVVAVATLPVVLYGGKLLRGPGLDRNYGIVFRVPTKLSAILPKKEDCTPTAVAEAMRFLCDEWLVDVATTYPGKCILIAALLSIIERSLLPDRPTFWVIAGRRGGGKTTTLIMLLVAVTGTRPPAAAWSSNEEERRKALLAYLLEALPAILWDNIPKGSQISCPHIEKSCTSAMYSDRKLGVSETIATSATIIHFFTGNNIGPRGDLASRSLQTRLEVDRHDPENREFKHPDPIAWTEAHRARILAALYTIAMCHPAADVRAQTRFKTWWKLVGYPIEFAARQHKEHVDALVMDANKTCPPELISFNDLFIAQEQMDEDGASLADALALLAAKWPNAGKFKAAAVASMINVDNSQPATSEDEKEKAMILREVLFTDLPPNQTVSARSTGRRLKRHVDGPVQHDGKTLCLRKERDTHEKSSTFYVEAK